VLAHTSVLTLCVVGTAFTRAALLLLSQHTGIACSSTGEGLVSLSRNEGER
jgi:hypothetical protein